MRLPADYLETYPKLNRLLEQIEARQLHRPGQNPRAWLAEWLCTPFDDLNGRQPAHFLPYADYDLILIGLLIQLQSSLAWKDDLADAAW